MLTCSNDLTSKRLLAAAIHKKVAVYEVAGNANTPVCCDECSLMIRGSYRYFLSA